MRFPFVLYKLDARTGEGIEGAKFQLFNDAFDRTVESEEDGELDFGPLPPGTYHLYEREAPIGYMFLEKRYKVVVEPDGTITVNGRILEDFALKNVICTGFGIFRKTREGEPVKGAVYEMRLEGCVIQRAVTNENGYASLECFPTGNYELVEAKVPKGYAPDGMEHVVKVADDGGIRLDGEEAYEFELFA